MADRISEIKSLLDKLSFQLVAELEAQRKEIEELKAKIAEWELEMEQVEQDQEVEQDDIPQAEVRSAAPVVEHPAEAPAPTIATPSSGSVPSISDSVPLSSDSTPSSFHLQTVEEEETFFTVTDLNDVHSAPKTTVSDLFAERNTIADVAQSKTRPWMVDIPGPKVEMIQSALTFNDRLTFIRELFEGDSEQFNITLDRINETSTFDEVVSDMRDAYPEWDENSPVVYRFYMEVRRKFRD